MKIRSRILLTYLLPPAIILGALGFTISTIVSNGLEKEIYSDYEIIASQKADNIINSIEEEREILVILASEEEVRNLLQAQEGSNNYEQYKNEVQAQFENFLRNQNEVFKISVINNEGKILQSTDPSVVDTSKEEIISIISQDEIFFKDIHFSEFLGAPGMDFGMPVRDEEGRVIGGLVADYSLEGIYEGLANNGEMGETGETYIINEEGYALSPLRYKNGNFLDIEINTENAAHCRQMLAAMTDEHVGHPATGKFDDYRGVGVIGGHATIPITNWCVLAEIDSSEAESTRLQVLTIIGSSLSLAICVFLLLSLLVSRRISKPIEQLHRGTEKIEAGDFNYKVGTKAKDEIGQLARSFDKMTAAIMKEKREVDKKVEDQTKDMKASQEELEDQQEAMLSVLEDVEEEKKKTGLLAKDLEKYKLAVDNASDHIIITNPDGLVIYMNDAAQRITGFDRKEILGKKAGTKENWGGLMDEDFYKELWKGIKKSKKPFIGGLINQRKNGDQYDAAVNIVPIINERKEVEFFVGIERDITREKEVDRAKTEFVSLASHQLQTPLTSINWFSEMLLEQDAGKLNPEQNDFVKSIHESNQRMIDLVNGLLNVSRLEHGTFTIEPQLDDITKIADSVLRELEVRSKKGKIKVTKKYDKIPKIKVDPKLMRIILQNLLSNAIKYTPPKGKVDLEMKVKKPNVLITVKDTGYGIPTHQQDKMFSKLFRADNVREKDTEGTGLGLYIVKQILDNSGGTISFKSVENKGTTFSVTIPLTGMKEKKGKKKLI
ncbi:PAS domain-containing protein [Patescibacteria group bacterium]|nr:PAS domain-containing protein [Patescibacteria group bacterium]MBU1673917.1 PAS domain-containing protein [Patescibacteria group bacterium]MBU1963911.1 PAS domain-containing protein [Patescibacteria group bacterium]